MVNSSSFAGLTAGLPCRELTLGVLPCAIGCPILDLGRAGLTFGLLCVCARGRVVLFGADSFFVVAAAGVFSGVILGVFPGRRTAYGSAVAGLFSSGRGGRVGRRTVPDISEPVPVEFFSADLVDSPDMAEGGRAGPEDDAERLEAVLAPIGLLGCGFAGVV